LDVQTSNAFSASAIALAWHQSTVLPEDCPIQGAPNPHLMFLDVAAGRAGSSAGAMTASVTLPRLFPEDCQIVTCSRSVPALVFIRAKKG
jgi:hypothetical protein